MESNFNVIQQLLQERADYQARLNLIPYDGSPEVKGNSSGKYLYIRKRVNGRLTSTYVDVYSDELYQMLLRSTKEARDLKKQIRRIDKELVANGYTQSELSAEVINNLDFARADQLNSYFGGRTRVAFGIGTYISNDTKVEPLNIVMKTTACNGMDVAKLSDVEGKGMCKNPEYVHYLKRCIDWRMKNDR